jgi:hypothetical protein
METFMRLAALLLFLPLVLCAEATFNVPSGWNSVAADRLPTHVETAFIGKRQSEVPPTLNLARESISSSQEEYLRAIKKLCIEQGREWKSLGTVDTASGTALLGQSEMQCEWGTVRMLQAILVEEQMAHILTASALQEEFADHYEQFFQAIRSLKVN